MWSRLEIPPFGVTRFSHFWPSLGTLQIKISLSLLRMLFFYYFYICTNGFLWMLPFQQLNVSSIMQTKSNSDSPQLTWPGRGYITSAGAMRSPRESPCSIGMIFAFRKSDLPPPPIQLSATLRPNYLLLVVNCPPKVSLILSSQFNYSSTTDRARCMKYSQILAKKKAGLHWWHI